MQSNYHAELDAELDAETSKFLDTLVGNRVAETTYETVAEEDGLEDPNTMVQVSAIKSLEPLIKELRNIEILEQNQSFGSINELVDALYHNLKKIYKDFDIKKLQALKNYRNLDSEEYQNYRNLDSEEYQKICHIVADIINLKQLFEYITAQQSHVLNENDNKIWQELGVKLEAIVFGEKVDLTLAQAKLLKRIVGNYLYELKNQLDEALKQRLEVLVQKIGELLVEKEKNKEAGSVVVVDAAVADQTINIPEGGEDQEYKENLVQEIRLYSEYGEKSMKPRQGVYYMYAISAVPCRLTEDNAVMILTAFGKAASSAKTTKDDVTEQRKLTKQVFIDWLKDLFTGCSAEQIRCCNNLDKYMAKYVIRALSRESDNEDDLRLLRQFVSLLAPARMIKIFEILKLSSDSSLDDSFAIRCLIKNLTLPQILQLKQSGVNMLTPDDSPNAGYIKSFLETLDSISLLKAMIFSKFLFTRLSYEKIQVLIRDINNPSEEMKSFLTSLDAAHIDCILSAFPLTPRYELQISEQQKPTIEQKFDNNFIEEVNRQLSDSKVKLIYIENVKNHDSVLGASKEVLLVIDQKNPKNDSINLAVCTIFEKVYKDFQSAFVAGIAEYNDHCDEVVNFRYVNIEALAAIAQRFDKQQRLDGIIQEHMGSLTYSISSIMQQIKAAQDEFEKDKKGQVDAAVLGRKEELLQEKQQNLKNAIQTLFKGVEPLNILTIIIGLGSKENREFFLKSLEPDVFSTVVEYLFPFSKEEIIAHNEAIRLRIKSAYPGIDQKSATVNEGSTVGECSRKENEIMIRDIMDLFSGPSLNHIGGQLEGASKDNFTNKTSACALRRLLAMQEKLHAIQERLSEIKKESANTDALDEGKNALLVELQTQNQQIKEIISLYNKSIVDLSETQKIFLLALNDNMLFLIFKQISDTKGKEKFISALPLGRLCKIYDEFTSEDDKEDDKKAFKQLIPLECIVRLFTTEQPPDIRLSSMAKSEKDFFAIIRNRISDDKTKDEVNQFLKQVNAKFLSSLIKQIYDEGKTNDVSWIYKLDLECVMKIAAYEANHNASGELSEHIKKYFEQPNCLDVVAKYQSSFLLQNNMPQQDSSQSGEVKSYTEDQNITKNQELAERKSISSEDAQEDDFFDDSPVALNPKSCQSIMRCLWNKNQDISLFLPKINWASLDGIGSEEYLINILCLYGYFDGEITKEKAAILGLKKEDEIAERINRGVMYWLNNPPTNNLLYQKDTIVWQRIIKVGKATPNQQALKNYFESMSVPGRAFIASHGFLAEDERDIAKLLGKKLIKFLFNCEVYGLQPTDIEFLSTHFGRMTELTIDFTDNLDQNKKLFIPFNEKKVFLFQRLPEKLVGGLILADLSGLKDCLQYVQGIRAAGELPQAWLIKNITSKVRQSLKDSLDYKNNIHLYANIIIGTIFPKPLEKQADNELYQAAVAGIDVLFIQDDPFYLDQLLDSGKDRPEAINRLCSQLLNYPNLIQDMPRSHFVKMLTFAGDITNLQPRDRLFDRLIIAINTLNPGFTQADYDDINLVFSNMPNEILQEFYRHISQQQSDNAPLNTSPQAVKNFFSVISQQNANRVLLGSGIKDEIIKNLIGDHAYYGENPSSLITLFKERIMAYVEAACTVPPDDNGNNRQVILKWLELISSTERLSSIWNNLHNMAIDLVDPRAIDKWLVFDQLHEEITQMITLAGTDQVDSLPAALQAIDSQKKAIVDNYWANADGREEINAAFMQLSGVIEPEPENEAEQLQVVVQAQQTAEQPQVVFLPSTTRETLNTFQADVKEMHFLQTNLKSAIDNGASGDKEDAVQTRRDECRSRLEDDVRQLQTAVGPIINKFLRFIIGMVVNILGNKTPVIMRQMLTEETRKATFVQNAQDSADQVSRMDVV